jgi:hypothetical protein
MDKMRLSKELNDALEAVSKEVDSWPDWKRSVDMQDLNKLTHGPQNIQPVIEPSSSKGRPRPLVRAAKA